MATTDTHTVIEELMASGISKEAAKVFVKYFVIKEDLSSIEKEHTQLAIKMDMAELKVSIAEIKTNILKWMIPFFLTIVALNITTIRIIISYLVK